MGIERIQLPTPAPMQGLEDLFPKEMQEPIMELMRRYIINRDSDIKTIRANVIVDSSILPSETSGSSTSSDHSVATSLDIEEAIVFGINWQG